MLLTCTINSRPGEICHKLLVVTPIIASPVAGATIVSAATDFARGRPSLLITAVGGASLSTGLPGPTQMSKLKPGLPRLGLWMNLWKLWIGPHC